MKEAPASARFFDAIARRYDRAYARGKEESAASLARVLALLPPRSRVLDLGVGTGRELPALLDAGHQPVGLDCSREMLALCAKRARPIPLVLGDLWSRLPFGDKEFDAVLSLHGTLTHPPDEASRAAFPREVARVLKRGGVFVAEVPTAAWLDAAAGPRAGAGAGLGAGAGDGRGGFVRLGEGRGRFVDEATGASVEVWVLPAEGWRELFSGVMQVEVEAGEEGEVRIVGRVGG